MNHERNKHSSNLRKRSRSYIRKLSRNIAFSSQPFSLHMAILASPASLVTLPLQSSLLTSNFSPHYPIQISERVVLGLATGHHVLSLSLVKLWICCLCLGAGPDSLGPTTDLPLTFNSRYHSYFLRTHTGSISLKSFCNTFKNTSCQDLSTVRKSCILRH